MRRRSFTLKPLKTRLPMRYANQLPCVLAFAGPKHTGKSAFVAALGIRPLSFATPLKKATSAFLQELLAYGEGGHYRQSFENFPKEEPLPDFLDLFGVSLRLRGLYQGFGETINKMDKMLWTRMLLGRPGDITKGTPMCVVIDDLRHDWEAETLLALPKKLRPVVIELRRKGIRYTEEHISECPLPRCLVSATIWLPNRPKGFSPQDINGFYHILHEVATR